MTIPLRLAHAGPRAISPVAIATPSSRVNPVVRGALLLFVFSIPFEMPHRTFPVETTTVTILLFLATTLTAPKASYGKIPGALMWFALHLWLLAIAALVNKIEFVARALEHFFMLTTLILLMWALSNLLREKAMLRQVLVVTVIACTLRGLLQILGIGVTHHEVWTGGERTSLFGQNANYSAMILSAGIVTCVGLVLAPARWLPNPKLFVVPTCAAMGWAAIETGSRGGVLCAMLGLVVFLFSGRTVKTRVRNLVLGLAAMAAIVFGVTQSPMMKARFQESENGKMAGREIIYPALIAMIAERPLFGWGPIDNQYEIARRIHERNARRPSRDAHNIFGELFTTSGVFGAVPFMFGLALTFATAWRARRGALGYFPLALLIAVFTGCISGTWIASKLLWYVFGIVLAAGTWWSSPSTIDDWTVESCAA